jgi:hypothetical protein
MTQNSRNTRLDIYRVYCIGRLGYVWVWREKLANGRFVGMDG